MIDPGSLAEAEEALRGALAGQPFAVALVDVGGDQLRALGVGTGDDQGRDPADVGGEAGRDEVADMRLGRDQNLAAEMAAFLLGGELVLEMDRRGARLDIGLHDLEAVQGPAEAGLGVGDDRHEPVALGAAFGMLDLVGALEGSVDPAAEFGTRIGGVEGLVGIHGAGGVGIGGDLPAGEVDGLQAGPHHLHRLVAGHRAQRVDVILGGEKLPKPVGAAAGEAVLDRHRAAQPRHFVRRIRPDDAVEATEGSGNEVGESWHGRPST